MCLGPCGGPGGGAVSYERGTPVARPSTRLIRSAISFTFRGLGGGVAGLWFEVWYLGFGVWASGFRVSGLWVRVSGSGLRATIGELLLLLLLLLLLYSRYRS